MSHQAKSQVMRKKILSPSPSQMKNHHYLHLQCASWPKVTLRYVIVKMIVLMSLTLMSLLTSLMSIHPSSRGKRAKSRFLRALVPSWSLPTPICLASTMTCSKSTMSHLYLLSKLKRATKSLNKSIGSWLTSIKNLNLPMKQLTQVLRTLLMKLLRRSMLLLHVMTYSLMQMLLMLCPSLHLLGKRNWWIKWQASRVVWRSSQEENTSTRKFSSTMHVTMEREVLVHFRSQIKVLLHLRRSRLASSRKLVHIANIAKSPGTTLGSAPYHHALFPLYQRITHQCSKITIFF